jgi:hypothetical protein
VELEHAFHQGKYFAGIAKKLKGSAWSAYTLLRYIIKHLQIRHTHCSLVVPDAMWLIGTAAV